MTAILRTASLAFLFPFAMHAQVPKFSLAYANIGQVPLPQGYERVSLQPGSFGYYLRHLPLRKTNTVFLYDGTPKQNQSLHYAVIDISTGAKDLQQCADLVMRLRAEYFFSNGKFDSIQFLRGDRSFFRYTGWKRTCDLSQHACLMHFMEQVFIYCGTQNLAQQLKSKKLNQVEVGDVLIKGGSPGHAEIVVDMAVDKISGKKIFMLAESYMPAQDAHLVLNPSKPRLGPWYELSDDDTIITATWIFTRDQLRSW